MSLSGAVNKSITLIALCMIAASMTWGYLADFSPEKTALMMPLLMGSMIVGFLVFIVTMFKKSIAPITGPLYAVAEGVLLGAISLMFERSYPGIAVQAIFLTFGVLFSLLFAYKAGWVKVTDKFRTGVMAATGAIFLVYLVSFIMSFFGTSIPMIHSSGPVGIGFSLVVVGIAAMNLLLDFDFIEKASQQNLPKYMEWFSAMALLVTLVWLYLEILKLLSKMRSK
jgi:uncharacterized YccA/Bax inhibitor family protein